MLSAVFLAIEARAKEAIVPLDLWRNRTYASSMLATFLVSFGFFGAIIFLPRWFQVVRGDSATASGYEIFPLLIGLIGSSIVAGILVARTGKYKVLVIAGIAIMAVGLILMSSISTDEPITQLWFAMFITGIGIGPTLSVYTIIVQNAVPFNRLGVATGNLTFFRQIGGSVGLAIAGTVFANALAGELPKQIGAAVAANVPADQQASVGQALGALTGNLDLNNLTGVGQSFGAALASKIPELAPVREAVRPRLLQRVLLRRRTDVPDRRWHRCGSPARVARDAGDPAPPDDRTRAGRSCRGRHGDCRRSRRSGRSVGNRSEAVGGVTRARQGGPGVIHAGAVRFPGCQPSQLRFGRRSGPPARIGPRSRRSSPSTTSRPVPCVGYRVVTSTSCSPTRRSGSWPSMIDARTWPRRCRSGGSRTAS